MQASSKHASIKNMDACANITQMANVNLRLGRYLEDRNLTAYKLAMKVSHGRANTVYRLVRRGEDVQRLDLDVFAEILTGLRELTGEDVSVEDLLEYTPNEK